MEYFGLASFINLTQARLILKDKTSINKMYPIRLVCEQAWEAFSWLIVDMREHRPLWVVPPVGWWSKVL